MDNRKVIIGKLEIPYKLVVSKRARYIRLQISQGKGLELIIPSGCAPREAEKFIESKKDWIERHFRKYTPRQDKYLYLGESIEIRQQPDASARNHRIELNGNRLHITSPAQSRASLNTLFDAWLKLKATQYIPKRTEELAGIYGFKVNRITIRGQKTRWGSCSKEGNLSFNFRLMSYSSSIIDYVIVHELCHLREMNHSPKFWAHVAAIMPDYKLLRKELKSTI